MADSSVNDTVNDLKTTTTQVGNELAKTVESEANTLSGKTTDAKQAIKDGASKYSAQAADKARTFAEDGKARASGALEQIAQLLTDAAGQVDEKLGSQYGGYARNAADSVSGFADQVKAKDIDELFDDARELVRKSPAIAVGAAAAIGFVVARLVQSGVDANPKV
ncbi:conserved hypothetical protein [Sphingomonas aurantiaca]|jgi:ElaB/YqjD/DUF883 family membrane-anchored ribosome-binding protein|uniref:ElaB/YqjD/DUF883 family membrane-anchored ribosome-binding protein n=1 Tax=Sphingomonas aurantiaca TaxID=185949 RepID=A0A5E7ZIK7_9SPHN|nr:hypothetical protein [Sphingomonas aurantiaca]VVT18891.1 conserved hypothetical protein [Sphingomonas aurantiaca]